MFHVKKVNQQLGQLSEESQPSKKKHTTEESGSKADKTKQLAIVNATVERPLLKRPRFQYRFADKEAESLFKKFNPSPDYVPELAIVFATCQAQFQGIIKAIHDMRLGVE